MALELVLEDKISFEATECNHLVMFEKNDRIFQENFWQLLLTVSLYGGV